MKKIIYIFVIIIAMLFAVAILLINYEIPITTKNLKIHYIEGSDICENENFHTAFENEYCIFEYVKNKSLKDYKILENIRKYCLYTTKNEYERRECIERKIY